MVDDEDHLLGIITQDDVADVLEAEATEDIERLGGSQPLNVPYRLSSVSLLVRKRVGWLLLLFVAEAYTGTVLRSFSDELEAAVALSFFIPLLIGTGGNIGSQTVTLIVRAMALNEVSLRDVGWIVWKELRVGLVLGAIMAVVALGRAQLLNVGVEHRPRRRGRHPRDLPLVGDRGRGPAADPPPPPDRPGRRVGAADHDARRRHRADHLLRDRPSSCSGCDVRAHATMRPWMPSLRPSRTSIRRSAPRRPPG